MADPAYIVNGVLTDGEAWVGIGSTTLGSAAAAITFTSTDDGQVGDWSQYMDLVAIVYARSARVSTSGLIVLQLNNDTGSNYDVQWLYGDGSSAAALAQNRVNAPGPGDFMGASASANIFGCGIVHFFDINSGKYKSMLSQSAGDRDGAGFVELNATTWTNQAPITEIDFIDSTAANLEAASRIDLFGVLPRMVA